MIGRFLHLAATENRENTRIRFDFIFDASGNKSPSKMTSSVFSRGRFVPQSEPYVSADKGLHLDEQQLFGVFR